MPHLIFAAISLFLPPCLLRQGLWGSTEREQTSPNRRFAPNKSQEFDRKNTVNEKRLELNEKKVFLQRNLEKAYDYDNYRKQ
jgi:hypothetical protein